MTTTMTEAFDAPMTDSGDVDISMYPGTTSTDTWLSMEASMGDDTLTSHSTAFDYVQEGIEIEMGDDDDAITEYEMADDGEGFDVGQELQDVEVYDVDISQAASPLMIDPTPANASPEDTTLMTAPSSDDNLHGALPTDPAMVSTVATEAFSTDLAQPNGQPQEPSVVVVDVDALQSTAIELGVTEIEGTAAHVEGVFGFDESGITVVESHPSENPEATSPQLSAIESTPAQPDEAPAVNPENTHTEIEESGSVVDAGAAEPEANQPEVAETVGTNDPHEISDGVYIDPPPPVLLSLPSTIEYGECSLFNLPTSSAPQSPSSSSRLDNGDALHLLLHDRPTLYYEPLSAVFAALRQEQCIQNLPGYTEAELVLEAYDLQLSISEDNVYTHEVTLHELNVLHDGTDLNGPLRLRLKVFTPRFVTRYTTLRDQIARLNISGDGEEVPGAQLDSTYTDAQSEQEPLASVAGHGTQEFEEQKAVESTVEPSTSDATDQIGNERGVEPRARSRNGSPAPQATTLVQEQALADAVAETTSQFGPEEGFDESKNEGDGDATEGAVTEAEQREAALTDDGGVDEFAEEEREPAYDRSTDKLDADEVHETTAEEAGDYVDYEHFGDDEDEFGDDLPEDFGGEGDNEADGRTTLADEAVSRTLSEGDEDGEYEHEVEAQVHDAGHSENAVLNQNDGTDYIEHSDSAEVPDGNEQIDTEEPTTVLLQDMKSDSHGSTLGNNVAPTEDTDDLDDNWENEDDFAKPSPDQSESLSRKSSTTTLASRTSKRAYEEVELDDFDDYDDFTPGSPDAKRPRTE